MHGEYGKSLGPKICLTIGHAISVVMAAWILFGNDTVPPYLVQKLALLLCSIIYFLRLCLTGLFLQRAIRWNEGLGITLLLLALHPGFAYLAYVSAPTTWIAIIGGVTLYITGSFLNTYSELQRHRWKQRHPGSLYTQGLFRWSMHINYFGDVVLFTGFALVTGSLIALVVPVVMGVSFVVYHIPRLDRHLARYGDAFRQWEAKTSKLIPFVY